MILLFHDHSKVLWFFFYCMSLNLIGQKVVYIFKQNMSPKSTLKLEPMLLHLTCSNSVFLNPFTPVEMVRWQMSIRFGKTCNSRTSLNSDTRIWIQKSGSLNSDTFCCFEFRQALKHFVTQQVVQELHLMFTKYLSVQIKFLCAQISSNVFEICILCPSLAHPMRIMLYLVVVS